VFLVRSLRTAFLPGNLLAANSQLSGTSSITTMVVAGFLPGHPEQIGHASMSILLEVTPSSVILMLTYGMVIAPVNV
jgi:hypothetical protein